jgi:hypothetical protein
MPKKKTSLIRSSDFRTVYAVGAIGSWTPYDFRINFYSEKISEDEEESYVNDAQIILTPKATKEFAYWLMQNINEYETLYGKPKPGKDDSDKSTSKLDTEFKGNLKDGLKEDIKTEILKDMRKYIKQNIERDIKKDLSVVPTPELQRRLKKDLKADLKQDLRKDMKPELRKDLKRVLKADLKHDLTKDIKRDLKEEIKRDLHVVSSSTSKLKARPKAKKSVPTSSKNTNKGGAKKK